MHPDEQFNFSPLLLAFTVISSILLLTVIITSNRSHCNPSCIPGCIPNIRFLNLLIASLLN